MKETNPRLASLDQFRGYTVLAMVFVNFAGGYEHIPKTFGHHHVYCSFADTIMPGFLFCVGMSMRLTFLRRAATDGARAAYGKAVKRNLGLIFVGCVVYHFTGGFKNWEAVRNVDFGTFFQNTIKRHPFEALTHIGVTSLFVLPVIARNVWVRLAYAIAAAGGHYLASRNGYYEWNMSSPPGSGVGIDGGPLGFLTWSVPLLIGSVVPDVLRNPRTDVARLVPAGIGTLAAAYGLSLLNETSVVPLLYPADVAALRKTADYWTMSQRAGTVTYTLCGAGFSLVLFAFFRLGVDGFGFRWGYLDLFGKHALVAYVAHDLCMGMVKPFVPKDAPGWYVLTGFGAVLSALTLILRYFERNKFAVRL